MQKEVNGLAV